MSLEKITLVHVACIPRDAVGGTAVGQGPWADAPARWVSHRYQRRGEQQDTAWVHDPTRMSPGRMSRHCSPALGSGASSYGHSLLRRGGTCGLTGSAPRHQSHFSCHSWSRPLQEVVGGVLEATVVSSLMGTWWPPGSVLGGYRGCQYYYYLIL